VKFPGPIRHFETNSDAYRCASIGLILLRELTFWRSATKVGAESSCTFHAALADLSARANDDAAARAHYERAVALARNPSERTFLERRAREATRH